MTTLGFIFLALVLAIITVWSHLEAYKRGYMQGRKDADREEDEWWFTAEEEVEREREKIWRGER